MSITITVNKCGDCPYFDPRHDESMHIPRCVIANTREAPNWGRTSAGSLPPFWCPLLNGEREQCRLDAAGGGK